MKDRSCAKNSTRHCLISNVKNSVEEGSKTDANASTPTCVNSILRK